MLRRTCTETVRSVFSSQVQMPPKNLQKKRAQFRCLELAFKIGVELKKKQKKRGGSHITCYSLSLQYEVLPTLPGSMCRRSQRRGGPMELRPESLPSPLHFLVPAQHDYVSELDWGILLAFIHRPSLRRGVEPPSPWHLLCAVPIKADTQ